MTDKQKNEIINAIAEVRDKYEQQCKITIAEEQGKIEGAYYMAQRIPDFIRIVFERDKTENEK